MASFTNFLTQGQPLPSSTAAYSTTQVPQYMSDYLYNLMSGAYSAAQQPYQAYTGPRIAGFTAPQEQAFNMTQNVASSYQPELTAGEQTVNQGAALNPVTAAQPYFDVASQSTPDVISSYMNPYIGNVINQMGDTAQQQITEKLLPQLNDEFTRAGQFGSTRQQTLAQQGVRDIANKLTQDIGTQLASGYTTAGQQAQADLSRIGSLGQAAGTLTSSDMANLSNLGQAQAALGQKEQALGLQGAGALETIGQEQQQQNQQNLNLAYSDYQNQLNYPETQLTYLSNIIRGLPSGGGTTATTSSSTGQTYSASPLAQLGSAATGALALNKLLSGTTS